MSASERREEQTLATAAPPVPNPLLLDLPDELVGPRVLARRYRDGDGAAIAAAVAESRDRLLAAHMPWVKEWDDPDHGTIFVRRAQAKWLAREDLTLGLWERATGMYVGSSGLHRIDWSVPNVEIGYWIRTGFEGRGFVTEATALIATFAFDALRAQRVRIRCDAENRRSAAVPRRLGFVHEATLRNEARGSDGKLRDTFEFGLTPEDFHAARAGPWRQFLSS
jgi:RimJ/RimL family protein N-acetyltransferase